MGGYSTKLGGVGGAPGRTGQNYSATVDAQAVKPKNVPPKLSSFQKFLATHRCVECSDVLIPKFSAGHASKAQRTCQTCSLVVCHKCFKVSTAVASGGLVCKSCRSTGVVVTSSASTAVPKMLVVVSLRQLTASIANGRGDSLLFLICTFATEDPEKLLRDVLRGWLGMTSLRNVRLNSSPTRSGLVTVEHSSGRLDAGSEEKNDSPGSPIARIPDFSEALRQTSGRVMTALRFHAEPRGDASAPAAPLRGGNAAATPTPSKSSRHLTATSGSSCLCSAKQTHPPQHLCSPLSASSCSTKLAAGVASPAPDEKKAPGQPQYLQAPKSAYSTPARNPSCSPMVTPSRGPLSSRREADTNRTGGRLTTARASLSKGACTHSPREAPSQPRGCGLEVENRESSSKFTKIRASVSPLPLRNACAPRGTPRPTTAREASRSPLSFVRTDSSTLYAANYSEGS